MHVIAKRLVAMSVVSLKENTKAQLDIPIFVNKTDKLHFPMHSSIITYHIVRHILHHTGF